MNYCLHTVLAVYGRKNTREAFKSKEEGNERSRGKNKEKQRETEREQEKETERERQREDIRFPSTVKMQTKLTAAKCMSTKTETVR